MKPASPHPIHEAWLAEARALMREREEEPLHVTQVTRLALQLFDALAPLHGLGTKDRRLLHAAALLHDIGWSKEPSGRKHHKIAAHIIREHDWRRAPSKWVEMAACIVRYHRGAPPSSRHRRYMSLTADCRQLVSKLAALLRIADGLDRLHLGRVERLQADIETEEVALMVQGTEDLSAEIQGALRKADLFEKIFRRHLRITQTPADGKLGRNFSSK
ncbi:MAG: HD domain-containing protein [Verrucomicrobia bacterium]|nr:HD domain-containing protein [Verrucomicrobiota bacterium]